jgi:hypothetical protein
MDCMQAAWALNCATHAVKTKVLVEQRMVFVHKYWCAVLRCITVTWDIFTNCLSARNPLSSTCTNDPRHDILAL